MSIRPSVSDRSSPPPSSQETLTSRSPPSSPLSQRPKLSSTSVSVFQKHPILGNQFEDDQVFQRVLFFYLPSVLSESRGFRQDLHRLARFATSKKVASWIDDAEMNVPTFESDSISKEVLEIWENKGGADLNKNHHFPTISDGWRKLGEWGAREGVVAVGYERESGPYSRSIQFAKYYLYAPSSALYTGPLAMTDGAASLLYQGTRESSRPSSFASGRSVPLHPLLPTKDQPGVEKAFNEAYLKLISRGGPGDAERWTSGQWMPEARGGSHISNTETLAAYSPLSIEELGELGLREVDMLGPWVISGYKLFSSLAGANMTILLAKTQGARGFSAFYAPLKRPTSLSLTNSEHEGHKGVEEWNGVPIVRQKKKAGKKPIATGEIELDGMRGWLIGEEGQGIKAISTVLSISRVHNSVAAVAYMRRALAIAKASSQVRKGLQNRVLARIPLHLRTLSHLETICRVNLHLSFFAVSLLGFVEHPEYISAMPNISSLPPQYITMSVDNEPPKYLLPSGGPTVVSALFRIITILAKATVPGASIAVVGECMEVLGGIGKFENEVYGGTSVQRLYRDVTVLSSWEGTTNTLAMELVKALLSRVDAASGVRGFNVLGEWVEINLGMNYILPVGENRDILEQCKVKAWKSWTHIERRIGSRSREELAANGTELANWLGYVVCAVLLIIDARRDGDTIAVETCKRWILELLGRRGTCRVKGVVYGEHGEKRGKEEECSESADIDYHITFGKSIDKRSGEPKL